MYWGKDDGEELRWYLNKVDPSIMWIMVLMVNKESNEKKFYRVHRVDANEIIQRRHPHIIKTDADTLNGFILGIGGLPGESVFHTSPGSPRLSDSPTRSLYIRRETSGSDTIMSGNELLPIALASIYQQQSSTTNSLQGSPTFIRELSYREQLSHSSSSSISSSSSSPLSSSPSIMSMKNGFEQGFTRSRPSSRSSSCSHSRPPSRPSSRSDIYETKAVSESIPLTTTVTTPTAIYSDMPIMKSGLNVLINYADSHECEDPNIKFLASPAQISSNSLSQNLRPSLSYESDQMEQLLQQQYQQQQQLLQQQQQQYQQQYYQQPPRHNQRSSPPIRGHSRLSSMASQMHCLQQQQHISPVISPAISSILRSPSNNHVAGPTGHKIGHNEALPDISSTTTNIITHLQTNEPLSPLHTLSAPGLGTQRYRRSLTKRMPKTYKSNNGAVVGRYWNTADENEISKSTEECISARKEGEKEGEKEEEEEEDKEADYQQRASLSTTSSPLPIPIRVSIPPSPENIDLEDIEPGAASYNNEADLNSSSMSPPILTLPTFYSIPLLPPPVLRPSVPIYHFPPIKIVPLSQISPQISNQTLPSHLH